MDQTHNNYRQSSGHGKDYKVTFEKPTNPLRNFFEETCLVAEMIYEQRTAPLYLAYSGGLDSEFVLAVFRYLDIPIRPVIMRNQYNHHDTDYALKFCEANNIAYDTIDMDYDQFVESGDIVDLCEEYKLARPEAAHILYTISRMDGTVITGDAPPYVRLNVDTGLWYLREQEYDEAVFNLWHNKQILGTPYFLGYTSEQWFSYLAHPIIQRLCQNQIPGKLSSHSSKSLIYNSVSPFTLEPRTKYHGSELIMNSKIYQHPNMQMILSWRSKWDGTSDQEYWNLMKGIINAVL